MILQNAKIILEILDLCIGGFVGGSKSGSPGSTQTNPRCANSLVQVFSTLM